MENINKKGLETIMRTYENLDKGRVINAEIDIAYELIPGHSDFSNPKSRQLAIRRFVLLNYNDIQEGLQEVKKPGRPKK